MTGKGKDSRCLPKHLALPPTSQFLTQRGVQLRSGGRDRSGHKGYTSNYLQKQIANFSPLLFGAESSSDEKSLSCHGKMVIRMLRKNKIRIFGWCMPFKPVKNQNKANLCRHSDEKTARKHIDMLIIFITENKVTFIIVITVFLLESVNWPHQCMFTSDVTVTFNFYLKSTGPGLPVEVFIAHLAVTSHWLQTVSSKEDLCLQSQTEGTYSQKALQTTPHHLSWEGSGDLRINHNAWGPKAPKARPTTHTMELL